MSLAVTSRILWPCKYPCRKHFSKPLMIQWVKTFGNITLCLKGNSKFVLSLKVQPQGCRRWFCLLLFYYYLLRLRLNEQDCFESPLAKLSWMPLIFQAHGTLLGPSAIHSWRNKATRWGMLFMFFTFHHFFPCTQRREKVFMYDSASPNQNKSNWIFISAPGFHFHFMLKSPAIGLISI